MDRAHRVLVAEDSPTQRALVVDILRKEGLDVHEAADGRLAVDLCRIIRPDMMILDLDLPLLTGTEVLARIRADHNSGAIPILVLTADDREQAVGLALDAGATDFLSKPAKPAELVTRVRRALPALP
jgi:DNA-binding response OmpR family regulator